MLKQLLILCCISVLPLWSAAQVCGLAQEEYTIDVNAQTVIPFEINNVLNNDLADFSQGVCAVEVSVQLGPPIVEFQMWLESPAGQRVQLIGPYVPSFVPGGPSLLNIKFIPAGQAAAPDPMFPNRWDNTILGGYPPKFNPGYQGTYYPFSGRLEDFNTGPVNGTWRLITDINTFFELTPNTLFDLRITLCDDAGQDCCFANAGALRQDDVFACQDSPELLLDLPPTYLINEIQPDTTDYGYTYAISQGGNLIAFDSIPDLTGLAAGVYEVCGLSFLRPEIVNFPIPNGQLTMDSLRRNLQGVDPFFCGDLADDCVSVTILPNAGPVSVQQVLCPGDTLLIGMDTLTTSGLHTVVLTSENGCDSLLEVDLSFYDRPQIDSVQTICSGSSIQIGNSIYTVAGNYSDTLQTVNGCDSVINLSLTVIPPVSITVQDTICFGEHYALGDSLFTQSGKYQVVFLSADGCDSTVNLDLTVVDISLAVVSPTESLTCSREEVWLSAQNVSGHDQLYVWYDESGNLLGVDSLQRINQAGVYFVEATRWLCSARDTVTVTQDIQKPIADAGLPDTITCLQPQVRIGSLTSSQGVDYRYEWSTNTGHFVGVNNQLQVTVDSNGTYQLVVTNLQNGCRDTSTVEIMVDNIPPVADAGPDQFITCNDPVAILDGRASSQTPQMEYVWNALSGNLQSTNDPLRPETNSEGIYELTVRNPLNGCGSSDQVAVFSDTQRPAISIALPDTITCDQPEVQLAAQVVNGGSNPVIEWISPGNNSISNGGNTLTPLVNEAGGYRLQVSNPDNGCADTLSVFVEANLDLPPFIELKAPDTFRCEGQIITLEFLPVVDTELIAIQWLDATGSAMGNLPTQDVNEPGSYRLELINKDNGCVVTDSIEVIDASSLPMIHFGDLTKSCDVDTFRIAASLDRDPSLFAIQWTGPGVISGADELQPLVNTTGDYIITLTALDIGCVYTDTATVVEPPCGPCLEADPAPEFTCRGNTIQLSVRYCDECVGCTIEWTTVDGQIRSGANTLTPTIGRAGTYRIAVTDSFNITAQLDIVVMEDRNYPIAEAGPDTTLNCRTTRLQLGNDNTDDGAGFQVRWRSQSTGSSSLGNTAFLQVNRNDTYILEVQNLNNGCISRDTVLVRTDTTPPLANAGQDTALTCILSSLILDGSGSSSGSTISYLWTSADGGLIDSSGNTPFPKISSPGSYTLQVVDEKNGCSSSDVVIVDLDDHTPEINVPEPGILTCLDSMILLEPLDVDTTLFRYEWCTLDNSGNISTCSAGPAWEVLSAGQYQLQVTDLHNGCSNRETVTVLENRLLPVVDAGRDTFVNCFRNQIQLAGEAVTASGMASFAWFSPNGRVLSGEDTAVPLIEGAGNYILTATDLNNGCSNTDTLQVGAELAPPEARLLQNTDQLLLTCLEDTLFLDASASLASGDEGLHFLWSTEEEVGIPGAVDLVTVELITGGIYHLTVQDRANGCRDTLTFQVNINLIKPRVSLSTPESLTCLRTEVTLDARSSETGTGIQHRWFFNDQLLPNNTLSVLVNQAGRYRLESTYLDNGCSNGVEIVVNANNAPPQISIAPPVILDCDNPAAVLDASATTGQALRFSWSTTGGRIVSGAETAAVTVDAPGIYTLQVVNGLSGCSSISSTEVNFTGLSIDQVNLSVEPPSCPGKADGRVRLISVDGGSPPFLIALNDDNFKTVNEFNELPPGVYQLKVMDAAGCEATVPVTLQEPYDVEVSLGPDLEIRKGEEVRLVVQTNVKEPQKVNWTPVQLVGVQDTLIQVLQPDRSATYQVEITDERGCKAADEVHISVSNKVPVYISNAFSPNEDGENDRFFIQAGSAVTKIRSFRIFDRWGDTLFEATDIPPNDPQLGWDGYYKGQLMNSAVFVYFAELELAGGDVEMVQGEVLLVR